MQKNGFASVAIIAIVALIILGSVAGYEFMRRPSLNPGTLPTLPQDGSSPALTQPPQADSTPSPSGIATASTPKPQALQQLSPPTSPQNGQQQSTVQTNIASTTTPPILTQPSPTTTTPPAATTSSNSIYQVTTTTTPLTTTVTTSSFITSPLKPIQMFVCGDPVSFTYRGATVTYGTIKSPTTGKCWMDRDLGANRAAQSINDASAYGDLFQWGRADDGHQARTSATTTALSHTDTPGNSLFIVVPNSPYDWRSPKNDMLWQGVSGKNNPCPSGWRIPTNDEWNAEDTSYLKLTTGGNRNGSYYGMLGSVGKIGYYWSSTVISTLAYALSVTANGTSMSYYGRDGGFSVRCIKN